MGMELQEAVHKLRAKFDRTSKCFDDQLNPNMEYLECLCVVADAYLSARPHTPGEWEVESHKDDNGLPWFSVDAPILERTGVVADTLNCDHCIDPGEQLANITLMAAAPRLLAACLAMIDLTGGSQNWNGDTHETLKLVEAAIRLAGK